MCNLKSRLYCISHNTMFSIGDPASYSRIYMVNECKYESESL